MKTELVHSLTSAFEGHAQQTDSGVDYWPARNLQHLLSYAQWRNFGTVISKAKVACKVSGHHVPDHCVDVSKMVDLGSDCPCEVAQIGDPTKLQIAFGHGADTREYIPMAEYRSKMTKDHQSPRALGDTCAGHQGRTASSQIHRAAA